MSAVVEKTETEVKSSSEWFVYIIRATDGSLYTGITTEPERRFAQHASGKGAKYFYGRKPEAIVFQEGGHDKSSASKREAAIKSLTKRQKQQLIETA